MFASSAFSVYHVAVGEQCCAADKMHTDADGLRHVASTVPCTECVTPRHARSTHPSPHQTRNEFFTPSLNICGAVYSLQRSQLVRRTILGRNMCL